MTRVYFSVGPGNFGDMNVAIPSVTTTAFDAIWTCAAFSPSRFAVTVMVPAVGVDRTATRLIPASVLR